MYSVHYRHSLTHMLTHTHTLHYDHTASGRYVQFSVSGYSATNQVLVKERHCTTQCSTDVVLGSK